MLSLTTLAAIAAMLGLAYLLVSDKPEPAQASVVARPRLIAACSRTSESAARTVFAVLFAAIGLGFLPALTVFAHRLAKRDHG